MERPDSFAPPKQVRDCRDDFRNASLLKRLTFSWVTPLARIAYRSQVQHDQLWRLRDKELAQGALDRLQTHWDNELARPDGKPSLKRAIRNAFKGDFFVALSLKFVWLVVVLFATAYLITALLNEIQGVQDGSSKTTMVGSLEVPYIGFVYAVLFGVTEVMRSTVINAHWWKALTTGLTVRAATNCLIFEKLTRLRSVHAVGEVVNLLSNDGQRLLEACQYGTFVVSGPITLVAIVIVGVWVLGPAILIGFVLLILAVPVQGWVGKQTGALRRKAVNITDERVSLMNEILSAVKLIKLYAWESSFASKVSEIRAREVSQLKRAATVRVVNLALANGVPVLVTCVTFTFHTLVLGEVLTAAQAFSTLSLFNVARFPLSVVPIAVKNVSEAFVSISRIEKFLTFQEVTQDSGPTMHDEIRIRDDGAAVRILVSNASFAWDNTELDNLVEGDNKPTSGKPPIPEPTPQTSFKGLSSEDADEEPIPDASLVIDEFTVSDGELVAVIGKVGSGKSSLLAGAFCGDMRRVAGSVDIHGTVAYCCQTPWCFNGTIKDNILMGLDYDAKQFNRVLDICALEADIASLPGGVQTEIGERGINLSGGQKARISLARAVYSDADIYLLDDVLSAVDVHVGKHIWNKCIKGALRNKTVLFVTHLVHLLQDCDRVMVLDHGRLVKSASDYTAYVDQQPNPEDADPDGESARESSSHANLAALDTLSSGSAGKAKIAAEEEQKSKDAGALIKAEDRQTGAVRWRTLKLYFNEAGGVCLAFWMLVLFFAVEGFKFLSDTWISRWTDDAFDLLGDTPSSSPLGNLTGNGFYAMVYFLSALLVIFGQIFRGMLFASFSLKASSGLHDSAFRVLMHATMAFFDTTPSGRILNRFSNDIDRIDVLLVDNSETSISLLARVILSFVVIAVLYPWFLALLVPMVFVYVFMLKVFRKVVRQMKRLESMSKSPLLSHIQSTVQGLTTIRSYGKLERYISRDVDLVNQTTRTYLAFQGSNRWLGYRLDFMSTLVALVTSVFCVLFASVVSPGLAGLALTSALQTAGILQFSTRMLAETEAQLTSVERLRAFEESTPLETSTRTTNNNDTDGGAEASVVVAPEAVAVVPESWPQVGRVVFENYSVRYQPHLPLVLKDLNFEVPGGHSCGMIGRTGCGKSTTMLCLFRILEASSGTIKIDGVDLASVPLNTLRARLSIIPQDPTLFRGTVRSNLDPFDRYTDSEIWSALEKVHLKSFVSEMPGGLLHDIQENGSNLSAGQRQLFCFGRALLRKSRVIAMDEATSSIDKEMDALIQDTIREAFAGHTLLIIAHRLDTVMQCDQIVVMDKGSAVEVGTPLSLIESDTLLRDLVHETGRQESQRLTQLASKRFQSEDLQSDDRGK